MDSVDGDSETQLAGTLVEERVAQLEEITQRRNVLLCEMYALMQRRDKLGLLPDPLEDPAETAEDLREFLDRFDLQKYPETGSVLLGLPEEDLKVQSPRFDEEENEEMPMTVDTPPVLVDIPSSMPPPASPSHDAAADSDAQAREQSVTLEYPPSEATREPASSPSPQRASEDVEMQENLDMKEVIGRPEDQIEEITSAVEETETKEPAATESAPDDAHSPSNLPSRSPSLVSQRPDVEEDRKSASLPSEAQKQEIQAEDQEVEDQEPTVRPQDIMPPPSPIRHLVSPPPRDPLPPITLNLPLRQPSSVTIMSALAPIHDTSDYTFDETKDSAISPPPNTTKANVHFHLNRHYSLPPLKTLPAEFQRKGKLAKQQRKRDKEKEKGENGLARGDGRGREARDDWTPMGINKWGAVMRANPLWRRMSRATKCLSTRDWGVAFEELRFIRTLERVEMAKDAGRWSYRQPKKQRGVGGLTKTHWDHLLDEMKWMRIDFREERKWKISLAFELSTAVLEWHEAGNKEERMRRGLIVDWHKPPVDNESLYDEDMDVAEDEVPGAESSQEQGNMMTVDYGSDDSDDDQEQDKQDVVDALEPTQLVEEALDTAETPTPYGERSQSSNGDLVPKEEDVEEINALRPDADAHNMDVDSQPQSQEQQQQQQQQKEEATGAPESQDSKVSGLKSTSNDPVLTGAVAQARADSTAPRPSAQVKSTSKSSQLAPLRGQIAYSDEHTLFLNLDEFHLRKPDAAPPRASPIEAPHPTDLSAIFPDLQVYGVLDVAPPSDGKKKTEKRDKDDPYKRAEDTTYSKLTPLGRFMREKPTLLGPLEPSKHWKDDHWEGIDDAPVIPDFEAQAKAPEDALCALFEGSRPLAMMTGDDDTVLPGAPRDPLKRVTDSHWTPQDDLLIKRLAEKYPRNWGLISDMFNASRGAISTERRYDWECKERYKSRWLGERGNGGREVPSASAITPATPARPQPQMTTRKRLASVTSQAAPTPAPPVEPRKRRRHVLMYDTIRKVMKKREAAQKASANPKKPPVVHDTHGQYNKMPKLSPAQLSKMKAEKEQQEALARRRNEEFARSQMNAQRLAAQSADDQAQPVATPAPNGAPRPPTVDIPQHQTVPQIRSQVNISQQQRMPTSASNNAAVAAAARMSPQQILQAQQFAQQRALAAAANANQPTAAGINAPHMSPPYASRAATSSPAVVPQTSPPRSSATPNPPRPASAQQHVPITQASPTMHQPAIARQNMANMAHYFPVTSAQLTPEQMEQALRLQQIMQQQQQQRQASMQQQQQQAGGQPGPQYPQS
ncbi:hypothetical protein EWM64_g6494 [Hericium alpestre]|uniref:Vacuolar import and degradation protein 21 n=1 Tax=Hericium alpestre TaxID=135208 RepID=A0A4Y9ZVL0_9AGAM|nr:hypothetical protein EWM64_g6494 [Hericium alpestre]